MKTQIQPDTGIGAQLVGTRMSTNCRWVLLLAVVLAGAVSCQNNVQAAENTGDLFYNYQKFKSFGFTAVGEQPWAGLIQLPDGYLYGCAFYGGASGYGCVFRVKPDGTLYSTLHSFGDGPNDGWYPYAGVVAGPDNTLYGVTYQGGIAGYGTLFKIKPNGSDYEVLHNFRDSSFPNDGINPMSGLVISENVLYGTTFAGGQSGVSGGGVIFKFDLSSSTYTILKHLTASDGISVQSALLLASDGKLYGTASDGGSNLGGTIFWLNTDGSDFQKIYDFAASSVPAAGLVEGSDGALYGTTAWGGAGYMGELFKINKDGTGYTVLHTFTGGTGDGGAPYATLIKDASGTLYGVASLGGASGYGTVFKIAPNGTGYTTLHSFAGGPGDGATPYGQLLLGTDGKLYSVTYEGGSLSKGIMWRMNTDGTQYDVALNFGGDGGDATDPEASLVADSNGILYGVSYNGGPKNQGAIFKINPDGTGYSILYVFGVTSGDGKYPAAELLLDGDWLYGTTREGGSLNRGTIFKIKKDGTGYSILYYFKISGGDGIYPQGGLVMDANGILYGTTYSGGGTPNSGTIFKIGRDGLAYQKLYSFGSSAGDGKNPRGTLVLDNGYLYGVTENGGSSLFGTVFKVKTDGNDYSVLYHFSSGTDGRYPKAGLLLSGSDLYGTTSAGGANGAGMMFKVSTSGAYSALYSFATDGSTGRAPQSKLVLGADNLLYGTTKNGGASDYGVVFRIKTDGSGYTNVYQFTATGNDGRNPTAGLFKGSDNNLYGVTSLGGSLNKGTLFKLYNTTPVIGGMVADQAVNDNSTISPFSSLTITDPDEQGMAVTVTIINGINRGDFINVPDGWTRSENNTDIVYSRNFPVTSDIGSAVLAAVQELTFRPRENAITPRTTEKTVFVVSVNDNFGAVNNGSEISTVTTSVNDSPTISGTVANQTTDDKTQISPFANVVFADVDNPAQQQTVTIQLNNNELGTLSGGGFVFDGTKYTLTASSAAAAQDAIREVTFTPNQNRVAPGDKETASFTITINDGIDGSQDQNTSVEITSVNDNPVITEGTSVSVTMSKNNYPTPFALTLHATDVDPGHSFAWSVQSQGADGMASVVGNGDTATVTFTPNTWNYVGSDSFVISVSDGQGGTANITVNVTIEDRPTPTVVYVDDDYAGSSADASVTFPAGGTGTTYRFGYDAFATIQAGVDAVADGGTVNVAAGTYNEAINVQGRQGLTIAGAGRDLVTIKPAVPLDWNVSTYGGTRKTGLRIVDSDNFTLRGVTLDCDLIKGDGRYGFLYWSSTDGLFENNRFKNMSKSNPPYYDMMGYLRCPDCSSAYATVTIRNNEFIDTGRLGLVTHDYINSTIEGNIFEKTTAAFGYAMEIGSLSQATIRNNVIRGFNTPAPSDGSSSAGIYVENCFTWDVTTHVDKPVTIVSNEVYNCQYGIYIGNEFDGSAGAVGIVATVEENYLHDNSAVYQNQTVGAGMIIADEDKEHGSSVTVSINRNTFRDNAEDGIFAYTFGDGALDLSIANNFFEGHGVAGFELYETTAGSSSYSVNLLQNSFVELNNGIKNWISGVNVKAENNWWGSPRGPTSSLNAGGDGAAVVGLVDFSPWLGDGTDTSTDLGFQPNTSPVYYTPHHLEFSQQPGGAALGDLLSPQPIVRVINEIGGVAEQFDGLISLAIGNNPGGGQLSGAKSKNAGNGVATFTDLAITVGGGSGYTLVASSLSPLASVTSLSFDINNPLPTISSLSPFWKRAGTDEFTLTVSGNNFVPNSKVQWNGQERTTTFVSATELQAAISGSDIALAGTAKVKVVNPTPGGGTTDELPFRIEPTPPTVVYVDDGYAGLQDDTLVSFPYGDNGDLIIGYNAFATIQAGVNAVAANGTVNVAAGTYVENVVINKALSLLGPNADKPATDPTRGPEAIIYTSINDPEGDQPIVSIEASHVRVAGFMIDGDNPNMSDGYQVGNADVNNGVGIQNGNYNNLVTHIDHITVENNRFKNNTYDGVYLETSYNENHSWNYILRNSFETMWESFQVYAMHVVAASNTMSNVRRGLSMHMVNTACDTGFVPIVVSNVVEISSDPNVLNYGTFSIGIWINGRLQNAPSLMVTNNRIKAPSQMPDGKIFQGIKIWTIEDSAEVVFVDNEVDANGAGQVGVFAWAISPTASAQVLRGQIRNTTVAAVQANTYDLDPTWGGHRDVSLTVSNVTIEPTSGIGIQAVVNSGDTTKSSIVTIKGGTAVSAAGVGVTGVVADGARARVNFSGTDAASLSGNLGGYITLLNNGATIPAGEIDATQVQFDGKKGDSMSLDELFAVEDKITHVLDTSGLGFVRVKAANVFVTPNTAGVQRGIDTASASDTVNVAAGTYHEQIIITKALTVNGQDGAVLDGTGLVPEWTTGVKIKSGNVTFNNINVTKFTQDGIICGYEASIPGSLKNIRITNCKISDIQPGYWGFGIYAGYESEAFKYSPPRLTQHLDYSGLLIEDNEIVNTASSAIVLQSITATDGNLMVQNNYIHDGENDGIWIDCARNIIIRNNIISGNLDGIYMSSYADIYSGGTYNWSANQLNTDYGPKNIQIKGNIIVDSRQYGEIHLRAGWPSTISCNENSLTGNLTRGFANYLDEVVNAERNWWGNATGPTAPSNPGGTGVSIKGIVDFSPWLGDGTDTSTDPGFQPDLTKLNYLPTTLFFTTQPGGANLDEALSPQPVVEVRGENGLVASQYNGPVSLSIPSEYNPGGGELVATTVNAVNGVASFSGVKITKGGGTGYRLKATVAATPELTVLSESFNIANPVPTIGSLSPFWKRAGDSQFTLTVSGNNFVPNSVVYWNGAPRTTYYGSANQVTADISASDIASAGTATVKVVNPEPGGGTTDELPFRIEPTPPTMVYVDDGYAGLQDDTLVSFPYGDNGDLIIGYNAFATIQAGVNAVAANGTVNVAAGTYNEAVTIGKKVTLLGADADAGVSCAGQGQSVIDADTGTAITIGAADVVVKGFELKGAIGISDTSYAGVVVENNKLTVSATGMAMQGISGSFTLKNNCVNVSQKEYGPNPTIMPTIGIVLGGLSGAAPVIQGNNVSGSLYGYLIADVNCTTALEIKGGAISGVMQGVAAINLDLGLNNRKSSTFVVDGVSMSGFDGNSAVLDRNFHAGVYVYTGGTDVNAKITATIKNVTVAGTGKIAADCAGLSFADFSTLSSAGLQDITVENCLIQNNKNRGINVRGANAIVSIKQSTIFDNGADPYGTGGNDGFGIIARNNAHVTVEECFIRNPQNQVGYTVTAIAANANTAPEGPVLVVNNCSIINNGNGKLAQQSAGTLNASRNWWGGVDDTAIGGLMSGSVDFTPYLASGDDNDLNTAGFQGKLDTLHVTALGTQTGSSGRIQEAIDAVANGGTVNVAAGTYNEEIVIEKPLTINGANGAVLDGNLSDSIGVTIHSGNVTFNNMEVDNYNGYAILADNTVNMLNIRITNCKISGGGNGIYVGHDSQGFLGGQQDFLDFSGLVIDGNEIQSTGSAIVLQSITASTEAPALAIRNNIIEDNDEAIWIDCARRIVIENNEIRDNWYGIELTASIDENTLNGPYAPKDITVQGNIIENSDDEGIAIYNGWPATITVKYNSITGNSWGLDNYIQYDSPQHADILDATLNWWGSAKGPYVDYYNMYGDGDELWQADPPSVKFSPWLGDGTDTSTAPGFQPNTSPIYYTPSSLVFNVQPGGATEGSAFTQQPVVWVMNENGQLAEQFQGQVTLAIGNNPNNGTLYGQFPVTAVGGVATFTDLSISRCGNGYTLTASAPSLTSATSEGFNVANVPPTIGTIADVTINEDSQTDPLSFTVGDTGTPAGNLTLSAASDNEGLVDPSGITFGGANDSRTITVKPIADQFGTAHITVTVTDSCDGTASTTFTVTVLPVNDQPSFTIGPNITVDEDSGPQTFSGWATEISKGPANESDQILTFQVTAANTALFSEQPAIDPATGTLTFTPAQNAYGSTTVDVVLKDNGGTDRGGNDTSTTQQFTITINNVNDPPSDITLSGNTVAENDAGAVVGTITVSDPDIGDTHTVTLTDNPNYPSNVLFEVVNNVTLKLKDGVFLNYETHPVPIELRATDQSSESVVKPFTINPTDVNDAPQAADKTITSAEDKPYTMTAADFGFSDEDTVSPNKDFAAVKVTILPSKGALKLDGVDVSADQEIAKADIDDGKLTYSPALNDNGIGYASFDFKVKDGGGLYSSGNTITFNISEVNDPPVIGVSPVDYTTEEDVALIIDLDELVGPSKANVVPGPDNEGTQNLHVSSVDSLSDKAGTIETFFEQGFIVYHPPNNYVGTDTFKYSVTDDGTTGGNPDPKTVEGTISVTMTPVNDPPVDMVLSNDTVDENASGADVGIITATDPDIGDTLTVTLTDNPNYPSNVLFEVVNNVTLRLKDGVFLNYETGPVQIELRATDQNNAYLNKSFTIKPNDVNDAPQAADNTITSAEDETYTMTAADFGFSDEDTVSPNKDFAAVKVTSLPLKGALKLNNDIVTENQEITKTDIDAGKLTYHPALNDNGIGYASFGFQVKDGGGLYSSGNTITFNITSVNDPPVANDQSVTATEDTAMQIILTGSDPVEETPVTYSIVQGPAHGTLGELNANTGEVTYTPAENYYGSDSFTFRVYDGTNYSEAATVSITVNSVNDPPVAVAGGPYTIDEGSALTLDGRGSSDLDGTIVKYEWDLDNDGEYDDATGANPTIPWSTLAALGINNQGTYPIGLKVTDNEGGEGTDTTATLTVNNVAPTAVADCYSVNEDETLTVDAANGVLKNDTDPVDPLTAIKVGEPANGQVTLNADGSFTYTPNRDYHGTDSFTYKANDVTADSEVVTVTITVNSVNDPPVANDQSVTATEDIAKQIILTGSDPVEGTPVTYSIVQGPAHGTLGALNANTGEVTYTPAENYYGSDSFTFQVYDGTNYSEAATVSITVNPVNDPPVAVDDVLWTDESTTLVIPKNQLAANDKPGPDNESSQKLEVYEVGTANIGQVSIVGENIVYIPPQEANGDATFTYKVRDDGTPQLWAQGTVTVHIRPVNDAPSLYNVDLALPTIQEDTQKGVGAGAAVADLVDYLDPATGVNNVLDIDPNQDPLTTLGIAVVGVNTTHGKVWFSTDNGQNWTEITSASDNSAVLLAALPTTRLFFEPNLNFNGTVTDAITFRAWDRSGPEANGTTGVNISGRLGNTNAFSFETDTIAITVTSVNDPPVAVADMATTPEDGGSIDINVLANDGPGGGADENSQTLTVEIVSGPQHGTASVNLDKTIRYTPNQDFNGTDSITYRITDNGTTGGQSDPKSAEAQISITVTSVNDPPVALGDEYNATEDTLLSASSVLENDSDLHNGAPSENNTPLTAELVTGPQHYKSFTLNSDGTFTYQAADNWYGTDSFTYKAKDSLGGESEATTVTINVASVNDPPTTTGIDDITVAEDATDTTIDLTKKFSDVETLSANLIYSVVANDNLSLVTARIADNQLTLDYQPDQNGVAHITVQAADPEGATVAASFTVTVTEVNDPPVAVADMATTAEDGGPIDINVLNNDGPGGGADENSQTLTVEIVSGPQHGTAIVNPDKTIQYTPNQDFNGTDSITYKITDDGTTGGQPDPKSAEAQISITVTSVNDPPVAAADEYYATEDTLLNASSVLENDSDLHNGAPSEDNTPLIAVVVTEPQHAKSFTFYSDGTFTYQAADNWYGTDSFTYKAKDSLGGESEVTTVTINVDNVSDAPVAVDDHVTIDEDSGEHLIPVLNNDSDPDNLTSPYNDGLTVTAVGQASHGTAVLRDGEVYYTPNANYYGDDSFTYTISDGANTAQATVNVTVQNVPDAPVAHDDTATVDASSSGNTINVLDNDTDADNLPPNSSNYGLTVKSVTQGDKGGTVTIAGDGKSVIYTPVSSFAGTETFTYVATDGELDSQPATVTVTVNDVTAPVIATCPESRTLTVGENCSATVPDLTVEVVATDNVTPQNQLVIEQSSTAGTIINEQTTVTITVKDAANNQAQCTVVLSLQDGTPPTITAPENITLSTDTGKCYATVENREALGTYTASDNCGTPTVKCYIDNNEISFPYQFPKGETIVTWKATDAGGLTATDTQKVTVYDTEKPTITSVTAKQGGQDVKGTGTVKDGVVTITVERTDNCEGSPAPVVKLKLGTTDEVTLTTSDPSSPYTYTWNVSQETVKNGDWTATVTAADASGNTAETSFTLHVERYSISGQVQLQGFVGVQRAVVFKTTDSSQTVIKTWEITPTFTSGVASYSFSDVPAGTVRLSARTAWNLRRRLDVTFDAYGKATVNFTGTGMLLAGNVDGTPTLSNPTRDVINLNDYNIMASTWLSTTDLRADFDGNGAVYTGDYNLLKANMNKVGDPE